MTTMAWLIALSVTLPIAGLALVIGLRGQFAASYWTAALGTLALPLTLAPVLPWLVVSAPMVFEPITPLLVIAQTEAGVGETAAANVEQSINWVGIGFVIWLAGASARASLEIWRSIALARATHDAELAPSDIEARVQTLAAEMGVRPSRVHVYDGPVMVTGLLHPNLYLNSETISSSAFDQIVRHELAHMKRWDVLVLNAARLMSILLWFNPFLYAIEARRRLAAELHCDHVALGDPSQERARHYARALLKAAGSNSGSSPVVGFGVAPRKAIEMRLKSIVNPSPKPKRSRTVMRLLGLGVAAVALCGVQAAQANGVLTPPSFTAVILEGRQTSDFGPRFRPDLNRNQFHRGHDIAAPTGTPIHAPAAGEVTFAGFGYQDAAAWGYVVTIDHGAGWSTVYAHLEGSTVSVGDRVRPGQAFATVGNTGQSLGPHLHVEVHHDGEFLDPTDHLPGLARLSD